MFYKPVNKCNKNKVPFKLQNSKTVIKNHCLAWLENTKRKAATNNYMTPVDALPYNC